MKKEKNGRYTTKSVRAYIESKGCKMITESYEGVKKKMEFQCTCGNSYFTCFDKFKNRNQITCLDCVKDITKNKLKLSYSDVKTTIESRGLKLLDETYVNSSSQLKVGCECGKVFYTSYAQIKNGKEMCNKCSRAEVSESQKHTIEHVRQLVESGGCELISERYISNISPLEMRCICGEIFTTTLSRFTHVDSPKKHCDRCGNEDFINRMRHTYEYVEKTIEKEGCKLLSKEYINVGSDIEIECSCGEQFVTTFTRFTDPVKQKTRCSACGFKKSKGELRIEEYLNENNISFKAEYSIEDCKNIRRLRFDFAILSEDGDVLHLIEFQGNQHYEPIAFFGGEENYRKQVIRDNLKRGYCEENNIPLLEIPYYDFTNIPKILNDELKTILCQA